LALQHHNKNFLFKRDKRIKLLPRRKTWSEDKLEKKKITERYHHQMKESNMLGNIFISSPKKGERLRQTALNKN